MEYIQGDEGRLQLIFLLYPSNQSTLPLNKNRLELPRADTLTFGY